MEGPMIVYRVKTQAQGVKEWVIQPGHYDATRYGSDEAARQAAQDMVCQCKTTGQRAVLYLTS